MINWSQDGAFFTHARDIGIVSHVPSYNALVRLLMTKEKDIQMEKLSLLVENLWINGHPMKFGMLH